MYESRHGDQALIVALNIDDAPLQVGLSELGVGPAHVIAGSGMPAEEVVERVKIGPHGWRILRPL